MNKPGISLIVALILQHTLLAGPPASSPQPAAAPLDERCDIPVASITGLELHPSDGSITFWYSGKHYLIEVRQLSFPPGPSDYLLLDTAINLLSSIQKAKRLTFEASSWSGGQDGKTQEWNIFPQEFTIHYDDANVPAETSGAKNR